MRRFFLSVLFAISLSNSPVWAGVDFDGVDDYVTAGSAADIDNMFPATIALWANIDNAGEANDGRIFDKTDAGNGYALGTENTGDIFFFQAGTATFFYCSSAGAATFDTWQHIALTWTGEVDSTCSAIKLYVNGTLKSWTTTQGSGTRPTDAASNFIIGNKNAAGANTGDLTISNFVIIKAVLTQAKITQLANDRTALAAMNVSTTRPTRFWRFDETPDGTNANGVVFDDMMGIGTATADDGANNTGMTAMAEAVLSYP